MLASGAPLAEWLAWLETLSPKEIDLGLERVQQILERLDYERPEHVLLIAGTNGKGSSVAMTAALLHAAGKRVATYTSPHISRFNERFLIAGEEASDAEIIVAFEKIEVVRGDTPLTYFEFITLAAVVLFSAAKLDVWVLEVGLGGRLDATNAIDPTASLITNIALDHCDWLGYDIETIALEKSGVMRAGKTTVFGSRDVPESVIRNAGIVGAKLLRAGNEFVAEQGSDGHWNWSGSSRSLTSLRPPGLLGEKQIGNAAAVLALLDAAGLMGGIDVALINKVLPEISLSGRSELIVVDGQEWLIDVAHNPAAAKMLAGTLKSLQTREVCLAIVGVLDDKDVAGIIAPLAEHVDQWIAITADSKRAIAANELARKVSNLTGRACLVADSASMAVDIARQRATENDRIVVTGSFFTVAPVLDQLTLESRNKS